MSVGWLAVWWCRASHNASWPQHAPLPSARRVASGLPGEVAVQKDETGNVHRSTELKKWRSCSVDTRSKHGIPSADVAESWCGEPHTRLIGCPTTDRVQDLIDVCWSVAQKRHRSMIADQLKAQLYVNTLQSVARLPMSLGHIPTPTTRMCLYSYGRDSIISAKALLRFMGWPLSFIPHDASSTELAFLSGNSFSVPISGLMTAILYFNPRAPWWQ